MFQASCMNIILPDSAWCSSFRGESVDIQRGVNQYWHKTIRLKQPIDFKRYLFESVRELQIVTLAFVEIYSKTKCIKVPYKPLFEKGFKKVFFFFVSNTFLIKPKRWASQKNWLYLSFNSNPVLVELAVIALHSEVGVVRFWTNWALKKH